MAIIFQCDCEKCFECYSRRHLDMKHYYGRNKPRPLIVSRHTKSAIDKWAQEYPQNKAQALVSDHYTGMARDYESHEQRKSRLKKQHDEAMWRALRL
jgi:hypothetical protein